jgi:diguanylate cyclase (GGDEF)-like protein
LPDVGAVALLTCAFASVARRNHTPVSRVWLTGWIMIVLHFAVSIFLRAPGMWGTLALFGALSTLTWAGVLFMWASIPYRRQHSSIGMLVVLLLVNSIYFAVTLAGPALVWALNPAALLFFILPVGLTLLSVQGINHPMRWTMVLLYSCLSIFLLIVQHRPGNGTDLALNAVLFTVFLGCCMYFFYAYRRATAGAFITIAGFLAWAMVFVVGTWLMDVYPSIHVESEVWNLPKYVVAVGMILLLLEDQIEHNKHLALHDPLTGLPNRRLFEDRLTSALDRARRTNAQAALLIVDLNHFKQVNDTYGHHIGDLLLERVSAIFLGRVRRSDTVARTGGDEFSIILEEPANRAEAMHVSQALLELLHEPQQLENHTVKVGASIGIAVFPEDADEVEALCIAADKRMYEEKLRLRYQIPTETILRTKPLPN